MMIDAHTHMVHNQYLDQLVALGGKWAADVLALLARITQRKPHFTNVALRVESLDRNNIALQVVSAEVWLDSNLLPGDVAAQLAYARMLNDSMARITEESKGRLLCAGSVPLVSFEQGGRQEMERAINTLGLKAISLPAYINERTLDSPQFEPFWAQAAEMGVPILMSNHPALETDQFYEAGYDLLRTFKRPYTTALGLTRLVLSGIMERHPTLKVLGHHLGGMIPFVWGRISEFYHPEDHTNASIVRSLSKPVFDYFSLFYYDTAVGENTPAIRCAYELFGADRIVFATDAPWGPGTGESRLANYPKAIKSLGLSEADNKKIFEDNARRLFNLG